MIGLTALVVRSAAQRVLPALRSSTTPHTAAQLEFLGAAATVHAALALVLAAAAVALLVLLLRRRRRAPLLLTRFYALAALCGLSEGLTAVRAAELDFAVAPTRWDFVEFAAGLAALIVGGLYLALSRRVKSTFVT